MGGCVCGGDVFGGVVAARFHAFHAGHLDLAWLSMRELPGVFARVTVGSFRRIGGAESNSRRSCGNGGRGALASSIGGLKSELSSQGLQLVVAESRALGAIHTGWESRDRVYPGLGGTEITLMPRQ